MPILNPVAAGLFGVFLLALISNWILSFTNIQNNYISAPFVSWWGAAYLGYWSILFLLPALYVATITIPKWKYFLSFFGTFLILQYSLFGYNDYFILTGTLYFAIGIMALEIKTSPIKTNEQIIFGITGGIILIISNMYLHYYPILSAILILNLLFFIKKYFKVQLPNFKKAT